MKILTAAELKSVYKTSGLVVNSNTPLIQLTDEEIRLFDEEDVKLIWQSRLYDTDTRFRAVAIQQVNKGWDDKKRVSVEHNLCLFLMYEAAMQDNAKLFKAQQRRHYSSNPANFVRGWMKKECKAIMLYSIKLSDEKDAAKAATSDSDD